MKNLLEQTAMLERQWSAKINIEGIRVWVKTNIEKVEEHDQN